MKTHFILLTTTDGDDVAVNVANIAAVYERNVHRAIVFQGHASPLCVKESLGDILTLVGFPQ